ncbi:MAG: ketoacyl-ACP synthase III [Bacteroidales bacterium]|jgi:3-oxoacyl-[acyl-carrier-protein] synthase-3
MKTIINNINIKAIASYLPKQNFELRALSELYGEKEVENIIKVTGVERIRVADEHQTSSDLCYEAAKSLIENEKIDVSKIGGLVFASQTRDYILPSTSIILQNRLGLSQNTICMDVPYGCSGYIHGIFQAASWINSGVSDYILVLAGDTTTKIVNKYDKSVRMIFGDCGTATLVTKGNNTFGFTICSDGSGFHHVIVPAGGFRLPISEETSKFFYDQDKNGRTKNDLFMDGSAAYDFAVTKAHVNVNELLEYINWDKNDVGLFAIHQANKFMVNSIRKKIKADIEKTPINTQNYGNTGPSSIPLLLSDICSNSNLNFNLEKVIMSAIGVGLSWGSIACSLKDTNFYEPINK